MQSQMSKGWSPWLPCAFRKEGSWIPTNYREIPPERTYPARRDVGRALIEAIVRDIFENAEAGYLGRAFSNGPNESKTREGT